MICGVFFGGGVPLEPQRVPLDPRGGLGLLFGCILVAFGALFGGALGVTFGFFSVLVSGCVFGAASERGFERCWLHFG